MKYASANLVESSRKLIDYKKLDQKETKIRVRDQEITTLLHIFEARYKKIEKLSKFIQLYVVDKQKAYTISLSVPVAEQDIQKFEDLVLSFEITK